MLVRSKQPLNEQHHAMMSPCLTTPGETIKTTTGAAALGSSCNSSTGPPSEDGTSTITTTTDSSLLLHSDQLSGSSCFGNSSSSNLLTTVVPEDAEMTMLLDDNDTTNHHSQRSSKNKQTDELSLDIAEEPCPEQELAAADAVATTTTPLRYSSSSRASHVRSSASGRSFSASGHVVSLQRSLARSSGRSSRGFSSSVRSSSGGVLNMSMRSKWQQQGNMGGGGGSDGALLQQQSSSPHRHHHHPSSMRSMRLRKHQNRSQRDDDGEDFWEDAGHHDPSVMSSVKSSLSTVTVHQELLLSASSSDHPMIPPIVVDGLPLYHENKNAAPSSSFHDPQHTPTSTSHSDNAPTTLTPDKLTRDFAMQRLAFLFPNDNFGELPVDFPKFDKTELVTGKYLGRGGFSDVDEIIEIRKATTQAADSSSFSASIANMRLSTKMAAAESRDFVTDRCRTHLGETRFALKHLRSDIKKDPSKAWTGMVDLVVETRILLQLVHPNIIKLRAVARGNPLQPDFFLVLDRLTETLKARIEKWKLKKKKKPLFIRPFLRKDKERELLLWHERVTNAYELTSALEHMHEQRVIHRDLKPENIGFDLRGDIKIFDFGLSRQIHSTDHVYHLSMMTGSLRYMAPEVGKGEPYNQRCDVYSFSVLLWEMLTLKRPYDRFADPESLIEGVFRLHHRPQIPKSLPRSIQEAIKAGWDGDQFQRIDISYLGSVLRAELCNGTDADGSSMGSGMMRRSTKIFEFKDQKRPIIQLPSKGLSQEFLTELSRDLSNSDHWY